MKSAVPIRIVSVALIVATILALATPAAAWAQEIPWGGPTDLPDYVGAPAKPHPVANSGVPQNPLLAPNGFNTCHLDPWMSDTADVAGPLGANPAVLSTTLAEAREPYPGDVPWIFECVTIMFDSHGRLVAPCLAPHEATAVLLDPDTLQVLDHYHLDVPAGDPFKSSGRQEFMRSLQGSYSYLTADDRLAIANRGDQVAILAVRGTEASPVFEHVTTYDLADAIPGDASDIAGVMLDWQGRFWVATAGTGESATLIGVLNPVTSPDPASPTVNWYEFPVDEVIRNTFAVTKSGLEQASAYVVTSKQLYRIEAGADDIPRKVWSQDYKTTGTVKDGQYEIGSGTSPTILGEGKYVAITDNDTQMHVVVFRTDEPLGPQENRLVCEVPVFEDQAGSAVSNSLIGSRLSLIATNNYYYLFDWRGGQTLEPSAPGFVRVDIDPNGKGCQPVWTNREVATTTSPRLSTRTGLIYTVSREEDQSGQYVYYWTALDFRTGATVWKKMAGTGVQYDSFYPAIAIGPNGALYTGNYAGIMSVQDTH